MQVRIFWTDYKYGVPNAMCTSAMDHKDAAMFGIMLRKYEDIQDLEVARVGEDEWNNGWDYGSRTDFDSFLKW